MIREQVPRTPADLEHSRLYPLMDLTRETIVSMAQELHRDMMALPEDMETKSINDQIAAQIPIIAASIMPARFVANRSDSPVDIPGTQFEAVGAFTARNQPGIRGVFGEKWVGVDLLVPSIDATGGRKPIKAQISTNGNVGSRHIVNFSYLQDILAARGTTEAAADQLRQEYVKRFMSGIIETSLLAKCLSMMYGIPTDDSELRPLFEQWAQKKEPKPIRAIFGRRELWTMSDLPKVATIDAHYRSRLANQHKQNALALEQSLQQRLALE